MIAAAPPGRLICTLLEQGSDDPKDKAFGMKAEENGRTALGAGCLFTHLYPGSYSYNEGYPFALLTH